MAHWFVGHKELCRHRVLFGEIMQEIKDEKIVETRGKQSAVVYLTRYVFSKDEKLLMLACTFGGVILGIFIGHAL